MEIDGRRFAHLDEGRKTGHNVKGGGKFRLLPMAQHQRELVVSGGHEKTNIN
ncbi:alpha 3 protein [Bovine ephemeral fever virus]|uniref:Protein alpha-3 n=1 Tax=Bovine ephemeral fever virus (strain BB7721) TaxID=928297 RepID=VPA3_BEFVB|nr:alpha 3 protein [Bovine ephemeral fever virus]Q65477.1 RecName: Full=Protein alpha-3 [Bovine ephemeral fever virus strain BB7721]AAB63050.1 alpha3 protein [Bovine ephemeral fever virus]AAG10417.1 alpha 3 protein [Bovine ephemeral fever virus]WOZ03545.1 alpha 3 protein [Bovine ephemeral fever virus]